MSSKTFFILNYGCQMNVLEAQKMKGRLLSQGYEESSSEFEADIVIFNTCMVRETAERKIYGKMGQIHKKGKEGVQIALGGCVTQVKGEELYDKYTYVPLIFGSRNKHNIARQLEQISDSQRVIDLSFEDEDLEYALNASRDSEYTAFVEIMKGCNNYCSYCIVPFARGGELSNTPERVLVEIQDLLSRGFREIILLGQNVNSYGIPFTDGIQREIDFTGLLKKILKFSGLFRLRFITSHPKDFNDELADIIAEEPKMAHSLHLPVQSGSNEVLKRMNRKYSREEYVGKILSLREKLPDIALSTDMIFGFPGESEADFLRSVGLLKEIRYKTGFLFKYTPRAGTAAAEYEDNIPVEEKLRRLNYAIDIQKEITREIASDYIGTTQEVLFDGKDKTGKKISGRDTHDMIVVADLPDDYIGKVVRMKIYDGNSFTLFGRPENE